jgi:hypothetical protein
MAHEPKDYCSPNWVAGSRDDRQGIRSRHRNVSWTTRWPGEHHRDMYPAHRSDGEIPATGLNLDDGGLSSVH